MKKIYYLLLIALLASCHDELENVSIPGDAVEMTIIEATIVGDQQTRTRADGDPQTPVVYLQDHISRFRFVDQDRMTFTTIRRTDNPIARFNYNGIAFNSNNTGAWDRDKTTGSDAYNGASVHPERIYWSDATSKHTFIGYSLPQQVVDQAAPVFDWERDARNNLTFYGSIGDANATTMINYNPTTPETDTYTVKDKDGSEKPVTIPASSLMKAEDLLLAYDAELVPVQAVANVKFYHALSSVKVQVVLSEFYGSELDGYAIVDSMILKSQPTLYRWEQSSYKAAAKSNTHADNNPRDMFLWNYIPAGTGTNAGKTFTFYGITVPQEEGYQFQDVILNFRVKYPDPLKTDLAQLKNNNTQPQYWLEKDYSATIPVSKMKVYFHPCQCTIINIKLNHKDETMTIGAQYTDWDFKPTPDEGSLKKNSTFLKAAPEFTNRPASGYVTIAKDDIATADDATWLYYQREANGTDYSVDSNGNRILLDIYGNTGTKEKPYTICTANQLLSFAYEVSNGGVNGNGNLFAGKYIKLDAGIIMQEDTEKDAVSWIGIGTESNPFQGTFLGSERKITRLKGKPLFNYVGSSALIDKVIIENTLSTRITKDANGSDVETPNPGLTGNAALAENNAGIICACRVNGAIYSSSTGFVGSLVGTNTNTGTVFACHHTGFVKGSGTVCGLVGSNSGSILFSYHAGELDGTTKYGIAPSGTITECFYDSHLAPSVTAVAGATGKDTRELQAQTFVDDVYTAEEAEVENSKTEHLKEDSNGVQPGGTGYIRTYKDDYTPVKEGDPYPGKTPKAWNTRMNDWVTALPSDNAMKTHFLTHSYLYQPAAYPKVQ